jgi:hypothetical protein
MFAVGALGRGELERMVRYERTQPRRVDYLRLGAVAFGEQRDNPPLQAGDFLAWELNRRVRQEQAGDPPPVRTTLRRFRELPHRWFRLQEDDAGAQMLMALSVDWKLSPNRGARRSHRKSKGDP